jgi:hypothetical protein
MASAETTETEAKQKVFVFEVDDTECTCDKPKNTGAQIMAIAGISPLEERQRRVGELARVPKAKARKGRDGASGTSPRRQGYWA